MKSFVILFFFCLSASCGSKQDVLTIPPVSTFNCNKNDCVYYRVSGIHAISQPTQNSCWAATLTMLFSWKENKLLDIDDVVGRYGEPFISILNESDKTGITLLEELALYKTADLQILSQLNLSIEGWEYYLKNYGPLSVTIDANPPYGGTIHALLITGIYGKKDASNTLISYIDPKDGLEYLVNFIEFIKMYEAKYSVDWTIQIVHLPKLTI